MCTFLGGLESQLKINLIIKINAGIYSWVQTTLQFCGVLIGNIARPSVKYFLYCTSANSTLTGLLCDHDLAMAVGPARKASSLANKSVYILMVYS